MPTSAVCLSTIERSIEGNPRRPRHDEGLWGQRSCLFEWLQLEPCPLAAINVKRNIYIDPNLASAEAINPNTGFPLFALVSVVNKSNDYGMHNIFVPIKANGAESVCPQINTKN